MTLWANKFAAAEDLTNESAVESFFVLRLLHDLGYSDSDIKLKTSIEELSVSVGRRKQHYKPDFAIRLGPGPVRWVIDAKAPGEDVNRWIDQCASYCLLLNRRGGKVGRFMVTNGLRTLVYPWDSSDALVSLDLSDFVDGNPHYERLKAILSRNAIETLPVPEHRVPTTVLRHPSTPEITSAFASANDFIYKADNISPAAAFQELVKIVFTKVWCDRQLHHRFSREMENELPVPIEHVRFSTAWIDTTDETGNPIDAVLFRAIAARLEAEVHKGKQKRIFAKDEHIRLLPQTVRGVVARLERFDLFGIDEDLNGRLFESFLNSTMRGEELGQYFTPRSIVKLMTSLSGLEARPDRIDKVLDACCGTGGFLIEALAQMKASIDDNSSLSPGERDRCEEVIRSESLYGIDAGRDPVIAKIARVNMYLHGDGGSRIYIADALDKRVRAPKGEDPEIVAEIDELRTVLDAGLRFDVVLTNPPFAKEYSPTNPAHKALLEDYDLWTSRSAGRTRVLRSSVLFLERYRDLLKPGGRLLTIIDDNILGGKEYASARAFVREHFIIRAVVSLSGDAFQRSRARVKTSILYLTRKVDPDEKQPAVFMAYTSHIGTDDSARKRVIPDDAVRADAAHDEIAKIVDEFRLFRTGRSREWAVDGSSLTDRLDAKYHLLQPGRGEEGWQRSGLGVMRLDELATLRSERVSVHSQDADQELQLFKVEYSGQPVPTERRRIDELTYSSVTRVAQGDIVISHINAVNGAICVVPAELDGAVVSPEYSVLRAVGPLDPKIIVALLRSPEIRAEMLSRSSGIGRHRIEWEGISGLRLPLPPIELASRAASDFDSADSLEAEAKELRARTRRDIELGLGLDTQDARQVLEAFKPPK